MASCVRNIRTTNYQNLVTGFQVVAKNVGDAFLGHGVINKRFTHAQTKYTNTN